jgi:hypothetical protein
MFLQGNTARVLIAGSDLTKNGSELLEAGLQWCDNLVASQQRLGTSTGNEGGYWMMPGVPGKLDLSGNSLAAVALAHGWAHSGGNRRKDYQQALERYSRFLLEGSLKDETYKLPGTQGWWIRDGDDTGAFGFGYAGGKALSKPATLSTAAGAAFFAELYAVSRNQRYREISIQALDWILKHRKPNGELVGIMEGQEETEIPFTTITVCAEAIQAAYHLLDDPQLQQRLGKELENTVRQLMRMQSDNGTWGEGQDRQGCSGVASLLGWYYSSFKADETIPQSLDKFWQYLSNPVHSQSFGVLLNPVATSWMGLTTAEAIKPGVTFKKF